MAPYLASLDELERRVGEATPTLLRWFQEIHGVRYAALRYFNVAGAWDGHGEHHDPETHIIPIVLQVAMGKRQNVSVFGSDYPTPDGTCVRDYVHIYDLAMAHLLVMEALKDREALAYNLGNGNGFSVRQVIETARKITRHAIPVIESPRRVGMARQCSAGGHSMQWQSWWSIGLVRTSSPT